MLTLGIIGMSPGNAHPYSWSSIINGSYNGPEISQIGYPGVTAYLNANQDTLGLPGARVTHVWTQDSNISRSIAGSSGIGNIVENPGDMIGKVDAVILARDDAQNHLRTARPFIESDVPIFIDKPLAVTLADLKWYEEQVAAGKFIMSCSSMRYANECRIVRQDLAALGDLELVTAIGKKDWFKYGVHMLEALCATLDDPKATTVRHIGESGKDIVKIEFENGLIATVFLFMDITPTFQLNFVGREGWQHVTIQNSYSMFRDNLIEFIRSVREGKPRLEFSKTKNILSILIGADESRKSNGRLIRL